MPSDREAHHVGGSRAATAPFFLSRAACGCRTGRSSGWFGSRYANPAKVEAYNVARRRPGVANGTRPARTPRKLSARDFSPMTDGQNVAEGLKLCESCERRLPVTSFRVNAKLSSGLDSWCVGCHREATRFREATRLSRAKHRDRYNP